VSFDDVRRVPKARVGQNSSNSTYRTGEMVVVVVVVVVVHRVGAFLSSGQLMMMAVRRGPTSALAVRAAPCAACIGDICGE
jgi:hypothetical protein